MKFEYEHVKDYLDYRRKIERYFQEHPDGTVRVDWTDYEGLNKEEWEQFCLDGLNNRINSKGGLDSSHRENLTEIWRDGQTLLAQKQGKTSVYGDRFYSQYFRRRF